jgi:hypothetical protein
MPKPSNLRAEVRDGWWCLVLGGKKIATYVPTPAGRAAVEQVIENWRARRANGETDTQIIAAQGYRPTKPVLGTPQWLTARAAEQAAEIERLKAFMEERDPSVTGAQRGDAESDEPDWWPVAFEYARDIVAKSQKRLDHIEVARRILRRWEKKKPVDPETGEPLLKKYPKLTALRTFVSQLRQDRMLDW